MHTSGSFGLSAEYHAIPVHVHAYAKDDKAFETKAGICYTDSQGREYTYADLAAVIPDPEGVKALYAMLKGKTPNAALVSSWNFKEPCRNRIIEFPRKTPSDEVGCGI